MLSQYGFPKQLQNDIDASIPPFVSSYSVKVVPSNVSQVQSSTQTLTASSTLQLNGVSQNVIFDVPVNQGPGIFIDPRYSTINFRVNYEIVNTPSAGVVTSANLRSSGYAHWDRSYTQSQTGVILDDINLIGLVQDTLIQLEIDVAQRDALAAMYGFAFDSATTSKNANQGHAISGIDGQTLAAASSNYYSYSIPLINSLIGKGAKKFFNCQTGKLQVVLQSSSIIPITFVTGTSTTAPTFRCTIDNISLNLQYVNIGQEGMKMLNKTGIQYYDGVTYRVSAATLPASTSGTVSLLTGLRGSSIKAVFTRFTEASTLTTSGCVNGLYDSKMPQATSIAYNVNGVLVPPNPVDLIHAPATAFSFCQEANASFNSYEFKSGLVPSQYFIYLAGGTLATDADKLVSGAGNASTVLNQAQFLWGYNMEKISQFGIMDGMSFNSGNVFLNMTLGNVNTNSVTCFFICKQDIIYIHDLSTGEITSRL